MHASDASGRSQILALGERCRALVVRGQPLGMRGPDGEELYALLVSVRPIDRPPYLVEVGDAVPVEALPLLFRGNNVPARRLPDGDDRDLAIDWHAALAEVGVCGRFQFDTTTGGSRDESF